MRKNINKKQRGVKYVFTQALKLSFQVTPLEQAQKNNVGIQESPLHHFH